MNRTLFRKKGQGERKFKKRWNSVPDNGGRINAGLENQMWMFWTTVGDRERTRHNVLRQ